MSLLHIHYTHLALIFLHFLFLEMLKVVKNPLFFSSLVCINLGYLWTEVLT